MDSFPSIWNETCGEGQIVNRHAFLTLQLYRVNGQVSYGQPRFGQYLSAPIYQRIGLQYALALLFQRLPYHMVLHSPLPRHLFCYYGPLDRILLLSVSLSIIVPKLNRIGYSDHMKIGCHRFSSILRSQVFIALVYKTTSKLLFSAVRSILQARWFHLLRQL